MILGAWSSDPSPPGRRPTRRVRRGAVGRRRDVGRRPAVRRPNVRPGGVRLRTQRLHPDWTRAPHALHTSDRARAAWDVRSTTRRWPAVARARASCPPGTLGRRVAEFYRARGFGYPRARPARRRRCWPSTTGCTSSPTTAPRSSPSSRCSRSSPARTTTRAGFCLLAMVVSLFETGYLRTGAGLFEAFPGQLSRDGVAVRARRRDAPRARWSTAASTSWASTGSSSPTARSMRSASNSGSCAKSDARRRRRVGRDRGIRAGSASSSWGRAGRWRSVRASRTSRSGRRSTELVSVGFGRLRALIGPRSGGQNLPS